jgi:hypothetical protein
MKTKLVLLIALAVFSQVSFAQFNVGVKVGANLSKVDGKSFKEEFRYGYNLGGFAIIGLGEKLAFQPEIIYNQLQTKVDSNFKNIYKNAFSSFTNKDIKLNYLSIPLLLNYKFIGNFLTLQAGPQFGILVDQQKNLLENGKQAFKKGDFSMVGGAQIKVSKVLLSGRYVVGLNNINDIDNRDKWKYQVVQLSVGLSL